MAASPLPAQTVSTVRDIQFRSRWSNYHVDQPEVERATEARAADGEAAGEATVVPLLRSLFRTGPIVLRGNIATGWEFSNEQFRTTTANNASKSSFFVAPAVAAAYDREIGMWTVSFRYSAGYLRYLDDNFSSNASGSGNGSGGLSQTAGLDVALLGSRLAIRSNASASSGSGYDVERNQQTDRISLAEALFSEYALTEFFHIGSTASTGYDQYSGALGGTDNTRVHWAGSIYGDYILTGKTRLRLELGAGHESQLAGSLTAFERTYYQALLRATYQPTSKLTLTPALGLGLLSSNGAATQTPDGLRTVYSLAADYAPTEKTSVRLYAGVEGTAARPEFSLGVNWHPRPETLVTISIYQQSGLSTIAFDQNRTTRGVIGSVQQRLFHRLDAGLTAGWEKEELDDTTSSASTVNKEPYYLISANLAWQINSWLIWQAQSWTSSRRNSSAATGAGSQTRASVSLKLTF